MSATAMRDGLSIEGVRHSFEDEPVLGEISESFRPDSLIAVLGPSGCGKTTLLRCIGGLMPPEHGQVWMGGAPVSELRAKGKLGFAFQTPALLPWRNVIDNVVLPAELLHRSTADARRADAEKLLDVVGLGETASQLPFQLSGGMRQRVGLARALISRPQLLLLDEPFGALDGLTRDRLNETIHRIWRNYCKMIVFVTHSVEEAVFLADFVVLLSKRPATVITVRAIALGEWRDATIRLTDAYRDHVTEIRRSINQSSS